MSMTSLADPSKTVCEKKYIGFWSYVTLRRDQGSRLCTWKICLCSRKIQVKKMEAL